MDRDTMRKFARSKVVKHAVIILLISISAWLFLLVMGDFVILHPNAYRDLMRSILIPYALGILGYRVYRSGKRNNKPAGIRTKLSNWWEHSTPIDDMCLTFTLITLINSIMMLVGIDTPKQGVFAYIHMLTRVLIISLIVMLISWRDVWHQLRNFSLRYSVKDFYQDAHNHIVISTSKVFTLTTILYCILMIGFQEVIEPSGGARFYQILLGILLTVSLYFLGLRFIRKKV